MAAKAAAVLTAATLWGATAGAQLAPLPLDLGANGLGLALRRLPVAGSVLYVAAHPDDENNGVQVRLSRGLGLRAGLLTLTRGEGGQNEIGPERGEELGVLRTEELAAVHRYDGAEQIFGRAIDFGFSFSVDETFERWGREETLGDVVSALRAFRPDVVLSLPIEAPGGGQHHQAAAQLAREAFRAAADPARFPEQIAFGLRPWQARKLYEGGVGGGTEARDGERVVVPTGPFDPLLGMSWQQLGRLARAMHRCQGVGQLRADPLTGDGVYTLVDAEPPVTGKEADILDGVDISLRRLLDFVPPGSPERAPLASALDAIAADVTKAQASFDPRAPEGTAAPLAAGLGRLQRLREAVQSNGALAEAARFEIGDRLERKARDFETALALAHALAFEARADQGLVVPGQSLGVTVDVWNQGGLAIAIDDVSLTAPAGWSVERQSGEAGPLGPRESRALQYRVRVAEGAPATRPYWRRRPGADRYDVDAPALDERPWGLPEVVARLRYISLGGVAARLEAPAIVRYEGRWVGGEKQRAVAVVPALSVGVSPEVTVLPVEARSRVREFRVRVTENGAVPATARVRLEAPPGWRVEPRETEVSFEAPGQEVATSFQVAPPAVLRAGEVELRAVAAQGAKEYGEGYRVIAYDHIQERNVFRPATARLLALDVRTTPNVSVGYVMGTGDEVATAIEELGVPVTLLGETDLASGDLSRFTTIVTGIRAFQVRPDLRAANPRLIRYAEAGGHVVVQYNRLDFNQRGGTDALPLAVTDSPFAPYTGLSVTGNRVTDETAPMRVLTGDRLLSLPNALSPRDWEGWVQERGLNFAAVRDPRYTNLLASTDPFPNNPGEKTGILVVATVGKGTWTYTGLSLFRQLPAGVPGAYRLLANLLGRPRAGR